MKRRREFMALLGGAAAAAWPIAARAQQRERVRQIGVLMPGANSDLDEQFRLRAFQNGLRGLGWAEGHNIQIDIRKAAGNAERFRTYAVELVLAGSPADFGKRVSDDVEKWAKVIKFAHIKSD